MVLDSGNSGNTLHALVLAKGLLRDLLSAEIERGSTLHYVEGDEQLTLEDLFGKVI